MVQTGGLAAVFCGHCEAATRQERHGPNTDERATDLLTSTEIVPQRVRQPGDRGAWGIVVQPPAPHGPPRASQGAVGAKPRQPNALMLKRLRGCHALACINNLANDSASHWQYARARGYSRVCATYKQLLDEVLRDWRDM